MLGKLLKYDLKWINKVMYIYFSILFLITIAVKIIESFEQTFLMLIVDKIISGMFIACSISIVINWILRSWARFIQNIYKDESYLTHTLPVTKNEIFNSKIIASILSLFLSIVVIVICVAIVYLNKTSIEIIKNMYQSLIDVYGSLFAALFIVGMVLIILLEIIYFLMSGIFGITIGYRTNNYKTIKSIIIGIVAYGLLSTVSLIIMMIVSKFANFEIVTSGFPSLSTLKIMGTTGILVYLVFDLAYYFISKRLFNKGVNID